ncbi:NADH-quinone oxidoreductase subunit NuoN [Methylophaga pinxianii]|uniref:NADH-quinone oxidoreductase subunit NuoN n=1 Tax=Methylophaga pinxianii TaxID=2881052 RepID=UPI001CF5CECD|nr:NADH-quinone oxidoreductase subunit NuoN [Methylophaga pinxianii]MCB2427176.1 NADH-quinone oxidoreductase subunit NuoN [Methylophaga pinxianii]UPH46767.1 NADH-quinone oxidoreductase subunit NuoN [Methylophaga pinxianii]
MAFEVPNMLFALPEMLMLALCCMVLLVVAFTGNRQINLVHALSQLSLLLTFLTVFWMMGEGGLTFSETYIKDPLSDVLKLAICLVNMLVLSYSYSYLQARKLLQGEFYVLALFATLGMLVMVSAHHFLTLYLGLELMSLCLYAMVAMQRDSFAATEAGMKYFILGALASGMLLYGMSIIYGVTGELGIQAIAAAIANEELNQTVLSLGIVFLVIGLGFKFGAVPFHMWLPDVYQGAPTAITLFVASAPKIAAFAMLIRILTEGMGDMLGVWRDMLIMLAILSIMLGNILAIAQTNLKRMLAYSTISHVGFLLLGVLAGSQNGYAAALFYTLVYALMTLGGFGMILLLSREGFEAEEIEDFKGLGQRHPWHALMMLLLMFSMAGIPPLAGFYAKLAVIKSVVDVNLLAIAIVAVVMSVIGAYYYLRVVKVMFFDTASERPQIAATTSMQYLLSGNVLAVLLLGLFPGGLFALCARIFS